MQAHPSTHPQPLLHYPQCDPSFPSDRHNPHHPLKTPFQVSHFCSGETLWVVPPSPPSFCHISLWGLWLLLAILPRLREWWPASQDCPCSYLSQCPLVLVPAWQLLSLSSSTTFPVGKLLRFWKIGTKGSSFYRAFHGYRIIKKHQEIQNPKATHNQNKIKPTSHTTHNIILLREVLSPWCHGFFLAQDISCWASQPREHLVNISVLSHVCSHCHAESHSCPMGKLKASNLYCDTQYLKKKNP